MAKQTIEAGNAKSERKADIVFCIDATGSMTPCFDGIMENIENFIEGLDSEGAVDWRFRLLAYRDKHNDPDSPWENFPFTSSSSEFIAQLRSVEPSGGRSASSMNEDSESTLDALYIAIKSD